LLLPHSVATRLREADRSNLYAVGHSSHALQLRSLRILSPPSNGLKETTETEKKSTSSYQTDSKKEQKADEERIRESESRPRTAEANAPTRKIRRPVSIRRPKLIGKSVDGAAMQAVAASRARASTNHFKNAGSTPAKRPPRDTGSRDSSKSSAGRTSAENEDPARASSARPPQASDSSERRDETLVRVTSDFTMLTSAKHLPKRRLCSLQREAMRQLTSIWWPAKENQSIPRSIGDFLISMSPVIWSDACALPPLPRRIADIFPIPFAQWIAAWTPGLAILPMTPRSGPNKLPDSVMLASEIRNVRGCKCLAVVRIARSTVKRKGGSKDIVRSTGWILNLPRRSNKGPTLDSNATSMRTLEKDSAGMNKLATDLHVSAVELWCRVANKMLTFLF
jgi:hypothetical protein